MPAHFLFVISGTFEAELQQCLPACMQRIVMVKLTRSYDEFPLHCLSISLELSRAADDVGWLGRR
jgi:hypothetical protein